MTLRPLVYSVIAIATKTSDRKSHSGSCSLFPQNGCQQQKMAVCVILTIDCTTTCDNHMLQFVITMLLVHNWLFCNVIGSQISMCYQGPYHSVSPDCHFGGGHFKAVGLDSTRLIDGSAPSH